MCLPACKVQWEPQYLGICSVIMTATVQRYLQIRQSLHANDYCILEHAVSTDKPEISSKA